MKIIKDMPLPSRKGGQKGNGRPMKHPYLKDMTIGDSIVIGPYTKKNMLNTASLLYYAKKRGQGTFTLRHVEDNIMVWRTA